MGKTFFDSAGDQRMERQNISSWEALVEHVRAALANGNSLPERPWDVLDIGCHRGGLLSCFSRGFVPWSRYIKNFYGVEPIKAARRDAERYFSRHFRKSAFFQEIQEVPNKSVDVVISHEVLYLIPNLPAWMRELRRIMRPDGGAFIALGSHGENTAWLRWRHRLRELYGHEFFEYMPMEILDMGVEAGFDMELARLFPKPRRTMRYSPPENGWGEFLSAEEALSHGDQKLLFTFYPQR
jgi:SAM-dependent methyltransferase